MTRRLPRFDSHVQAFRLTQALAHACNKAAADRAANLPFFFSLTPADSFATVYDSDHEAARPVGTLTRPRMFGDAAAKLWTVAAPDGVQVWQGAFRPSPVAVTRYLCRYAERKTLDVLLQEEAAAKAAERAGRLTLAELLALA